MLNNEDVQKDDEEQLEHNWRDKVRIAEAKVGFKD